MMATPWPLPFDDPAWGFELKWDGVRALAYSDGTRLRLRSRNGNDLSGRYRAITALELPPGVYDGELIAVDQDGMPSFEKLARAGLEDVDVQFVVFDVLESRSVPVLERPLLARRQILTDLIADTPVTINDLQVGEGLGLFSVIKESGLEGMVAKKLESRYEPGRRPGTWRKVLNVRTVRCVVGGYARSEVGEAFSALLMGLISPGGLRYIGRVGSGFSNADRQAIRAAIDEMAGPDPFLPDGAVPEGVFCAPQLVAHVQFRTWTAAGRLRGPVFKGFGSEPVEAITWEAEGPGSEFSATS